MSFKEIDVSTKTYPDVVTIVDLDDVPLLLENSLG